MQGIFSDTMLAATVIGIVAMFSIMFINKCLKSLRLCWQMALLWKLARPRTLTCSSQSGEEGRSMQSFWSGELR